MSIHPEGKPCFDVGRVLVLNDSPAHSSCSPEGESRPISVECLFSMTLLQGGGGGKQLPRHGGVLHKLKPVEACVDTARYQRLKLKHDKLLSRFAFNFNLRHCPTVEGFVARENQKKGTGA